MKQVSWALCALFAGAPVVAQSSKGFTAGNIVVSRSVYTGSASTFAAGQPLPPVCPSTAKCGTVIATDGGDYASNTSSNNVFNNNRIDGSFGVTSPIFLDQLTPSGTLLNTLPIPTTMVTTSFSSKSELALNVSTDGAAVTFHGLRSFYQHSGCIELEYSRSLGLNEPGRR